MKKNYLLFEQKISLKLAVFIALFGFLTSSAQVTTNGGSGLAPTYPDLATAITALNGATITSPVVITLAGDETAPLGGYSITAQGSATNTITVEGVASTITAPTPQASGALTDAFFKLVGADWVTIQGFTMLENASNTTVAAATNNMTEWGVALLYATTTNGAQNNTIRNNTIDLNRTYQNTSGIYSNSTHSATNITTAASATTTSGGNSGLKIYSNTITDVNLGIVVIGPTAVADQNVGIDIGGTSLTTANTISNFGTTATFSGFANVSGTVNGILVRNSNGTNISYNTITSSVGGVTSGTLNGIQVAASSNAPTGLTFTNTINNNTISLRSSVATGAINGISYPSGSASSTSTLNINNNDFNTFGHTVTSSGTIVFIATNGTDFVKNVNNNTFTNISVNTTGSVTFISHGASMIVNGTQTFSNNAIVTAFAKTGAGGTVTGLTSGTSSANGSNSLMTNNNFSNITVTGATTLIGITNTDGSGSSPNRTITGNIFNNWTGGTSSITGMSFSYIGTTSTISNNTITNFSGQGTIIGLTIGSSFSGGNPLLVSNNIVTNLTSSGVGGSVSGIVCSNTSPSLTIINNLVHTLSSTAAVTVIGINVSASNTTTGTSISQNTIYNLNNSNAAGLATVTGVQIGGSGVGNVLQRNLIYDLNLASTNASAEANGIKITGGTNTLRNNMIRFGEGIPNAVLVSGINETVGTNSIFHNSVYVSGSPTTGTGNSFAFNGSQTVNVRSFRNNIFFNARSNSGATGKNYAVKVGGTGVNPAGLTINNNVYFANGAGSFVGLYAGTDAADLLAWQTAVGQDANSIAADPLYVSTTDLSLQSGSPAIDIAANLSVTNDFTGDSRPGLNSLFDIGADERDGIPLSVNDIQATAFINPVNGGSKGQNLAFAPQASFTNNGTANQTNITVRYRIVDPSSLEVYNQTFVIPSLASFAAITVTFPNATLTSTGTHTIFATAELGTDTVTANDQISGTLNVLAPLSGTYTVGTAGNFASLTNTGGIFDALNTAGATSDITINIISDLTGETGAVVLNEIAGGFTTLIKPTGAARSVSGNTPSTLIAILGADNVTIDGSLGATANTICPLSTATRDLTFTNTNTATTGAVIGILNNGANGASNNSVKNCNVIGNSNTTTIAGIFNQSSAAGPGNNNNTFVNNVITRTQYGIFSTGGAIATKNTGTIINQNIINGTVASGNNVRIAGIFTAFENNITISGNTIANIAGSTVDGFGIACGSLNISTSTFTGNEVINATITNNMIDNIRAASTYSASGIYIITSTNAGTNLIANNSISNTLANGTFGDFGSGIFVGGGAVTTDIYQNTVFMSGALTGSTQPNFAVAVGGANPIVKIRNNMFVNNATNGSATTLGLGSYAIGYNYSTFTNLTVNNNNYSTSGAAAKFAKTGSLAADSGTDIATLSALQTATGQDGASVSAIPAFTSTTDLTPLNDIANTALYNSGANLTASVPADAACVTRPTNPSLGFKEFTVTPPTLLTWTGATNTLWSIASNWSPAVVPDGSIDVLINTVTPNAPVLNVNVAIASGATLTVSGSGSLTVNPTRTLTIAGSAAFNDRPIIFKSDATGTAAFGTVTTPSNVTGATNVTVERYLNGRRAFRFLTPSVTTTTSIFANWQNAGANTAGIGTHITGSTTGANGFDATTTGNPSMFTYNAQATGTTTGFTAVPNTDLGTLTAGVGYRLLVRGDRNVDLTAASANNMNVPTTLSARGTLTTGTVTFDSTGASPAPVNNQAGNTQTNGYTLIGNPYASPVDWHAVTKTGVAANAYYTWDPTLGTSTQRGRYVVYSQDSGTANLLDDNSGLPLNSRQYLQTGQAVFIKNANLATPATLVFNESNKASVNQYVFRNSEAALTTTNSSLYLSVYEPNELALGGNAIDGAAALFGADYTTALDNNDVEKLVASGENLAFVRTNKNLAIETVAPVQPNDELFVKTIDFQANKNYTFKVNTQNFDASVTAKMVDMYLNTETPLDVTQPSFVTFSTTADANSYGSDRFKIVFNSTALENDDFATNAISVYPNPIVNNQFNIALPSSVTGTVNVSITNMLGQEVYKSTNDATQTMLVRPNQPLQEGVYIVSVNNNGKVMQTKVIVKN